jgi:hypothetical protein
MGMDTSCGICGKHYQSCQHFIKIHAINPETMKTFCGKSRHRVIAEDIDVVDGNWFLDSVDPDDLCNICKKLTKYEVTMRQLQDKIGW